MLRSVVRCLAAVLSAGAVAFPLAAQRAPAARSAAAPTGTDIWLAPLTVRGASITAGAP